MVSSLVRIKPIEAASFSSELSSAEEQISKRNLNLFDLIMFGIGNTIGAGIFAMAGVAVQYAGPSLFLSFFFAGGLAMISAMMIAELSSRIPHTNGSSFSYTYATFGELPAWIVGWNLNLRYGICSAGLARGLVSYFNGLLLKLGVAVPDWMIGVTIFG